MKREELLDLLGEFDDSFYEEVRGESGMSVSVGRLRHSEEPAEIRAEEIPVSRRLLHALPVAACLAAVGFIVMFSAHRGSSILNAGGSSEISEDSYNANSSGFSEEDIEQCRKMLMEKNNLTDETLAGLGYAMHFSFRELDLDFDGEAELIAQLGYCEACVFKKRGGKIVNICTADIYSVYGIKLCAADGESFFYEYANDTAYSPQNGGEIKTQTHSIRKLTLENDVFSADELLSYTIEYTKEKEHTVRFYNGSAESGAEMTEKEFREMWAEYPGMPDIDGDDFTSAGFRISDYQPLDMNNIPDVHGEDRDVHESDLRHLCIPKAELASIYWRGLKISLLGEEIRTDISRDPDMLYVYDLKIGFSENGAEICSVGVVTDGIGAPAGSFALPRSAELADYLYVVEFTERHPLIMFRLWDKDMQTAQTTFFTLEDEAAAVFYRDTGDNRVSAKLGGSYGTDHSDIPYTLIDNATGVVYQFDFLPDIYGALRYFAIDGIPENYLADCGVYDVTLEKQRKAILETQVLGEYNIMLVGEDVETLDRENALIHCSKQYIIVERDGVVLDSINAADSELSCDIDPAQLGGFIEPLMLKDGTAFMVRRSPLDEGDAYAFFYSVSADGILAKMRYEHDYGPAPATGSPVVFPAVSGIDSAQNRIIDPEGRILTFDFEGGIFSISE